MESLDNVRERIEALARRTEHWAAGPLCADN
jgi:hypothetical protein